MGHSIVGEIKQSTTTFREMWQVEIVLSYLHKSKVWRSQSIDNYLFPIRRYRRHVLLQHKHTRSLDNADPLSTAIRCSSCEAR